MANNSEKNKIMRVVFLFLMFVFWVNSAASCGVFHVIFKHFQNLENLILNILKETIAYPLTYGLLFP